MRKLSHSALAILLLSCERAPSPPMLPDPEILKLPEPRTMELMPAPDELFPRDRILEVDLFVAPEDWARVLEQVLPDDFLSQPDCQKRPFPQFPFQRGSVVIDREIVEDVGVRQRGSFYQLNRHIPNLEISFDTWVPNRRFEGRRHLFLESVPYDPTAMRACLAYRLFERAGIPAPACAFAHLRVNGNDYGIYVHVEAIDDEFAEDRFGVAGQLFEGKASDFREGWLDTFEGPFDRNALRAVRDALTVSDDQLLDRLSAVVDLDAFYRFWAAETVIGHFDGYAGNADRFYVFVHPERGLYFLPSAPETAFTPYNPFLRGEQPASVYAQGELARRLYLHPEGKSAYRAALEDVLERAWNEEDLAAEIARMRGLIADRALFRTPDLDANIEMLSRFILERRAAITESLGAEWTYQRRPTFCLVPRGAASARFTTIWDSLPPPGAIEQIFRSGTGTVGASWDDVEYVQVRPAGAAAGRTPEGQAVLVAFAETGFGSALAIFLVMDPAQVAPGTFQIDPQTSVAGSATWYNGVDALPVWTGYLFGTLELRRASTIPGEEIEAIVTADLY